MAPPGMSLGIPAVIDAFGVGTIWILIEAYSYRLATATRLARADLLHLHREIEKAGAMAGASRRRPRPSACS